MYVLESETETVTEAVTETETETGTKIENRAVDIGEPVSRDQRGERGER